MGEVVGWVMIPVQMRGAAGDALGVLFYTVEYIVESSWDRGDKTHQLTYGNKP